MGLGNPPPALFTLARATRLVGAKMVSKRLNQLRRDLEI